jgi:hypothetical protein
MLVGKMVARFIGLSAERNMWGFGLVEDVEYLGNEKNERHAIYLIHWFDEPNQNWRERQGFSQTSAWIQQYHKAKTELMST